MYTAIAPIPLAAFAGEPTQNIGKSFVKSYAAAAMVWDYIGQVVFNMLILVGTIKMSDRVVREMMGL